MISSKADVRKKITSEDGQKKELVVTACHRHHFSHKRMKIGRIFEELSVSSGAKQKKGNLTQVQRKLMYINKN